jgi:hypothetical protein
MQGTIRRAARNLKRWRRASMALRWSTGNCRLSDGHSPISILRIWKVPDEIKVAWTKRRPCDRM